MSALCMLQKTYFAVDHSIGAGPTFGFGDPVPNAAVLPRLLCTEALPAALDLDEIPWIDTVPVRPRFTRRI